MMFTTAFSTSRFDMALLPSAACDPLPRPCLPLLASSSSAVNTSHARRNGTGVFFSPMPMTMRPLSRRRLAKRVKSESLDTMQKPSTESL